MRPTATPDGPPPLPELAALQRPRLRTDVPLLWREPACIQLGDDVVVDSVDRTEVAWLLSIDGLRAPAQIEAQLDLPVDRARRLLRAAAAATMLEDAAVIPDAMRWAVQPQRDSIARCFGAVLRTYRDRDLADAAMSRRDSCRVHVVGTGLVAHEVERAVESAGLPLDTAAHAAITVLADSPHPDVPAHFDHAAHDRPHLQVGVLGERAVVGPLVLPGRTSCLRCAHLHRRDGDPAWPLLAVQWAQSLAGRSDTPLDPVLATLAATQAALLIRTWADLPDRPEWWSGFAVELRLPGGEGRRLARPAHPLCGCRWPGGAT